MRYLLHSFLLTANKITDLLCATQNFTFFTIKTCIKEDPSANFIANKEEN